MNNCLYYTAAEVQEMLGVSRGKAYKILKDLNDDLAAKGYIVIAGKIPKQFFNEHYYGLAEGKKVV
jgi:sugar-specific transcriptional regulator TrmB